MTPSPIALNMVQERSHGDCTPEDLRRVNSTPRGGWLVKRKPADRGRRAFVFG
jgi:hypothetical protein